MAGGSPWLSLPDHLALQRPAPGPPFCERLMEAVQDSPEPPPTENVPDRRYDSPAELQAGSWCFSSPSHLTLTTAP